MALFHRTELSHIIHKNILYLKIKGSFHYGIFKLLVLFWVMEKLSSLTSTYVKVKDLKVSTSYCAPRTQNP